MTTDSHYTQEPSGVNRGRNPKVYVASKLHHAKEVKQLILDFDYITFTNRWQFFEGEIPDTEHHANNFWENDFDDIDACDYVLVFGNKDDVLKGALVEAGYGLGKGKKVLCMGDSASFGTWQFSLRCMEGRSSKFKFALNQIWHDFNTRQSLPKGGE